MNIDFDLVYFDIKHFVQHFLNSNFFNNSAKEYIKQMITHYFHKNISIDNFKKLSFIYRQPLKSYYEENITDLRKRFLQKFKINGVIPVIGSFNNLVDEFLRSTLFNQFKMLSDHKSNNMLIYFLRIHELLETAILL